MKSFTIGEVLVYNPTLKSMKKKPIQSDIQQAKIMAYFPSTAPIEEKWNTVGMAEGVYQFCSALLGEAQKQNQSRQQVTFLDNCCLVLKQVEQNIWMYMKLSYYQSQETFKKTEEEEEQQYTYLENTFSEDAAIKVLQHFYLSFWTFYGNIGAYLFHGDLNSLQKILQYFIKTYQSINRVEQTKKLDVSSYIINHIRAIPLDVNSHLKFGYFKNVMKSYDDNVTDMIIFNNGLLVYSSLSKQINTFFANYFFGTGDPFRFDLNLFPKRIRLMEQIFMINPEEKYGTMFNSLKYGFGENHQTLDSRATLNINIKKKSQDLLGLEENDKLAFPTMYLKKDGEEHKLQLSCFFEKKMLYLTFFTGISNTSQIIFQNRFYHDNTDKFAMKTSQIYSNLVSQNDAYKFIYSNMSTYLGKCTIQRWQNFVPQIRYIWENLQKNQQGIIATTYFNHWVYGVHRFNRILVLMIPNEIPLHKLDEFTDKMTKEYFFKAFM